MCQQNHAARIIVSFGLQSDDHALTMLKLRLDCGHALLLRDKAKNQENGKTESDGGEE